MNKKIAGKIMSEVRGFEDVSAAVANELKVTRRGIPLQRAIFQDYMGCEQIKRIWQLLNVLSRCQSS
jgi:hypothetical protein